MFGSQFLANGSADSGKVNSLGNGDSSASFRFMQPVRHFCSLTQKMELNWTDRRLRITQMADFYFLGKLLMLAVTKYDNA